MYSCDVCNKCFPSRCILVVHYRMHTDERPFTCNVCQKGFRQKGHLNDHLKLHSDEESYRCLVCGQGFKQSSGLRNHRARFHRTEVSKNRIGRPRKPKTAESTVTNVKASRQQTVEIDVESLHRCDICDETFPTMTKLENHIVWHVRRKRYKCMVCSRIFKHLSIFKKHQELHDKRQKKCQKQHTNMSDVETQDPEMNKTTRTDETFCETCQKNFSCTYSLFRHTNEYHNGMKRKRGFNRIKKNVINKKHPCRVCRKKFANIYSLRVHHGRVHQLKTHKCHICGKTYGVVNDLKHHYKSHRLHLPYECDVCGKPFQYESKLKEHEAIHTKQKLEDLQLKKHCVAFNKQHSRIANSKGPHGCDVCGKRFRFPSRLKEHLIIHKNPGSPSSELAYHCNVCQKMFLYPSRLKAHYKIHAHEIKQGSTFSRPNSKARHPCNVCGKAFQYESHQKRHATTHKQEQSFSEPSSQAQHLCNVCGKAFQHESHLKRHQTSHYKQGNSFSEPSSEARHPCNVCGKAFPFESHLKRHETTHYKQEPSNSEPSPQGPFECNICSRIFRYPSQLREHSIVHNKQEQEKSSLNSRSHSKGPHHKKPKIKPSTSTPHSEVSYHQPKQEPTAITLHSGGYECDVCGNTFQRISFLSRHYVVHTQDSSDKPYLCAYCGRSFLATNHLKKHCQTQHDTTKSFRCETCLVAFEKKTQLRDHLQTCVGTLVKKDSNQNEIPADGELQHVKRRVGKQTKKPKVSTGNGIFKYKTRAAEYTNNDALQCTEKSAGSSKKKHGTNTSGKGDLQHAKNSTVKSNKKHFKSTTKKMTPTCNICGGKFCSNGALKTHLGIHLDQRPFSCRFCEMKFRQVGHLSAHCKSVHNEEFPYQCDLCNAPFKGATLLRKHQEIAHNLTENPNELDDFVKSAIPRYSNTDFEPKEYTKIVNSNQTEYACVFCDSTARTFKSLSGLRRHITIVHTTAVSQPISDENGHTQRAWNPRGIVTIPREESPVKLASSEEIYKCNVCSVIVHGWEALEAHEKAHATKNINSPRSTPPMLSTPTPPAPTIKQTFECKFCGWEFDSMSREAFDQHQLEHELAAEEPMGMAYICAECDKEFAMAGDLIKHHEEAH